MKDALSLLELNRMVRRTIDLEFQQSYWIQAELSEVREAYQGHCYLEFVQKDEFSGQLVAKARGAIWASAYRVLKPYFERETGQCLAAGIKVLVCVRVVFHELYGYTLTVEDIDPAYTLGDLARRRREILDQLRREGVIDDNKNLVMPLLATRVAVISSRTAAGFEDFCDQLLHNDYGFRFTVRLFPAVMQGERVEETVLAALDQILEQRDRWDVVVIIRGGGATSDLSGFDTYLLAASCAQFPLPIITGIGHERDDTVLDAVAHTRVKTPTAAAACLLNHMLQTASRLEQLQEDLLRSVRERLTEEQLRLTTLITRLPVVFNSVKSRAEQQILSAEHALQAAVRMRVQRELLRLDTQEERLAQGFRNRLEHEKRQLDFYARQVQALNPERLLKLGYSLTYRNGQIVTCADELQPGDVIETHLAEGRVHSKVL